MPQPTRLIDTAILIDYLRGNSKARAWLDQFQPGDLIISVVTAAELLAGCRNLREQTLVEQELKLYPMIWLSGDVSKTAWDWYRQYHLSHGVGFLDCLIGANAYHYKIIISTLNDKHFRPFPDLQVERPY